MTELDLHHGLPTSYTGERGPEGYLKELLDPYKSESDWLRGINMKWEDSEEPTATRVLFGHSSIIFEQEGPCIDGRRVQAYSIACNGVNLISGITGDAARYSTPCLITNTEQLQVLEFRLSQIPRSE